MSRITKPKRARGAVKRLDLSDMRSLFKDRRVWTAIGIVTAPEGDEHWQIVQNDQGTSVDVIVEVVLQPSEEPCSCRLAAGIFDVPDEGDEVAVLVPDGELDFMPLIVCRLSTNNLPTAQGPQPGRIAIVRGEVVVHDGAGGAVSLALKSDVQAVRDDLHEHSHAFGSLVCSGGTVSGSTAAGPSVTEPTGTSVLLGK
jgi:hypothetical protein